MYLKFCVGQKVCRLFYIFLHIYSSINKFHSNHISLVHLVGSGVSKSIGLLGKQKDRRFLNIFFILYKDFPTAGFSNSVVKPLCKPSQFISPPNQLLWLIILCVQRNLSQKLVRCYLLDKLQLIVDVGVGKICFSISFPVCSVCINVVLYMCAAPQQNICFFEY